MKNIFKTEEYLIFTIEEIRFGVKTSRVSKMVPLEQVKLEQLNPEEIEVCWFHERIVFSKKEIFYQTPMVLWVKDRQEPMGIVVDQPGDILKINRDDIRPLPQLIRQYSGTAMIEFVALKNNVIILLMNMDRLITHKE